MQDEYSAFADNIAAELRSLPNAQAQQAKRKLARALNEIMEDLMVSA